MKMMLISLPLILLLSFMVSCNCDTDSKSLKAQSFIGAWERYHTSENGDKLKSVVIFSEGYQVITTRDSKTGKFISTNGGTWKLVGDTVTEKIEFDSNNSERVGTEVSFEVFINDSILGIVGSEVKFNRISS